MELCLLPTTSSLSSIRLKSCPSSESASWTQSLSKWNTSVAHLQICLVLVSQQRSALSFILLRGCRHEDSRLLSSWLVDQILWNQRQFAGKHVSSPEPPENSEPVNPGFQVVLNSNLQETRSEDIWSIQKAKQCFNQKKLCNCVDWTTRVLGQRFAFSKGLSFRSFALAPWSRWYDTRGYRAHPTSCRWKQRLQTRDRCQTFKSRNGTQRA